MSEGALWLADLYRIEVRRVGRQVEDLCARSLDQLPYPLALVGGEVVHHHHVPFVEGGHEHLPQIAFEHRPVRPPSTTIEGPIPEKLMLESRVMFLPRLRATEQYALSPFGE